MARVKCPECGCRGANVAIWGSAYLSPDGKRSEPISIEVDWKDTFHCLNFDDCEFVGYKSDFMED